MRDSEQHDALVEQIVDEFPVLNDSEKGELGRLRVRAPSGAQRTSRGREDGRGP